MLLYHIYTKTMKDNSNYDFAQIHLMTTIILQIRIWTWTLLWVEPSHKCSTLSYLDLRFDVTVDLLYKIHLFNEFIYRFEFVHLNHAIHFSFILCPGQPWLAHELCVFWVYANFGFCGWLSSGHVLVGSGIGPVISQWIRHPTGDWVEGQEYLPHDDQHHLLFVHSNAQLVSSITSISAWIINTSWHGLSRCRDFWCINILEMNGTKPWIVCRSIYW